MSTIRALRAVDEIDMNMLDEAMEGAGTEEPAPPDPDTNIDRWAEIHRGSVALRLKRIAATRKEEREFVKAHKATIKRLEAEIAEHKESAARKIEAEQKIVKASKAFLAAVEE